MQSVEEALEHLCDPKSEVSAHYLVEENGKTHNLVPEDKRAWHAGVSYWKGETDVNSHSIGIEIINKGHEFGYEDFSHKQTKAVLKLCKDLMEQYDIPPANILGHSDIAITRKVDPGHLFPWEKLAHEGIGLWPSPREHDYQAAEDVILDNEKLKTCFTNFGYDPAKPISEIVVAFHRRYAPEKFERWDDQPDEPDIATIAKLLSLIAQSQS